VFAVENDANFSEVRFRVCGHLTRSMSVMAMLRQQSANITLLRTNHGSTKGIVVIIRYRQRIAGSAKHQW